MGAEGERPALSHSVARTLVTHYWPFTVIVLAFATMGMALAPVFDPRTAVAVLAAVWVTLEGFHAIDLADPDLALDVDSRVQRVGGYAQVAVGGGAVLWVAARTTPLLAATAVVGLFLGLAYNEEWFDGRLHDRDRVTGLANFGVAWGAVPVLLGSLSMGSVGPGVAFVALGCGCFAVSLNVIEGPAREARYEQLGIEHDREAGASVEEFARKAHTAQLLNAATFVSLAVGLLVRYGPV